MALVNFFILFRFFSITAFLGDTEEGVQISLILLLLSLLAAHRALALLLIAEVA